MDYLVGYTGFVGQNIAAKHSFDGLYNSKNIEQAYGGQPDLLVYSGVPAEMFLANNQPEKDLELIENAKENIRKIGAKYVVLISTIAVYPTPNGIDEDAAIDTEKLTAYGKHRRYLEEWVEQNCENYTIVRLPALYGQGIKKNFIYDLINIVPAMLTEAKFSELSEKDGFIKDFYAKQDNGFWKHRALTSAEHRELKEHFLKLGFSALNFTDSRSVFQFYNLGMLWEHIEKAVKNGIKILNTATEPIQAAQLYKTLMGGEFKNELNKAPFDYDYRTKYSDIIGGKDGYILDKASVLEDVCRFVREMEERI